MKKKAQLQMNETIFVVFIILIIIMLGFVAYSKFQEVSIKEQQKDLRSARVVSTAHQLSFWPELECSEAGGISEFSCLDVTKLKVLGDFINTSKQNYRYAFNYYFDLLKNSKITVTQVYPFDEIELGTNQWAVWDNPGRTKTIDNIRVPVNLYDPLTKIYTFGIMELQIYE
jgi:hypothetical protein